MATNHASDMDAVGALFDRAQGTKAKHDEAAGEGTSRCFEKRKNNKRKGGEYVAAMECMPGNTPEDDSPHFFDDLLEKPCPNHARRGEQKKKPEPEDAAEKEKQGDFPKIDGCLMIFGGPLAWESKRKQKVTQREVFAA